MNRSIIISKTKKGNFQLRFFSAEAEVAVEIIHPMNRSVIEERIYNWLQGEGVNFGAIGAAEQTGKEQKS